MNWTRCDDALPAVPDPDEWEWATESDPVLTFTNRGETYIARLRVRNEPDDPIDKRRD